MTARRHRLRCVSALFTIDVAAQLCLAANVQARNRAAHLQWSVAALVSSLFNIERSTDSGEEIDEVARAAQIALSYIMVLKGQAKWDKIIGEIRRNRGRDLDPIDEAQLARLEAIVWAPLV